MEFDVIIGRTQITDGENCICVDYDITPPERKTHYISIPFRQGDLDLTDAFGRQYEMRTITMLLYFRLDNAKENLPAFQSQWLDWMENLGRTTIVFSNDHVHEWRGRLSLDEVTIEDDNHISFEMSALVEPFKYAGSTDNEGVL